MLVIDRKHLHALTYLITFHELEVPEVPCSIQFSFEAARIQDQAHPLHAQQAILQEVSYCVDQ